MTKKPNPILQEKFREGYNMGFEKGMRYGREIAIRFFAERFKNLKKEKGVGEKTLQKVKKVIGEEYFTR